MTTKKPKHYYYLLLYHPNEILPTEEVDVVCDMWVPNRAAALEAINADETITEFCADNGITNPTEGHWLLVDATGNCVPESLGYKLVDQTPPDCV